MNQVRFSYRHYYAECFRIFCGDIWRIGAQQVVGAILAALIFLFQWHYGLIPQDHGWLGIKSLGWPYLILVISLCLLSAFRTPALIAKENFQNSVSLSLKNEELQRSVENLHLQLEQSATPKRSTFLQKEFESVKARYAQYDQLTKAMAVYILRNRKVINQHHMGIFPLPEGFRQDTASAALKRLKSDNIVTSETHAIPGGWEETYTLTASAATFLEEIIQ